MRKRISWMDFFALMLIAFVLMPLLSFAAETDAVIAQDNTATLVYTLVVALIPIIASLFANLTQKADDDSPWARVVKNIINLLALNFSEKAGK